MTKITYEPIEGSGLAVMSVKLDGSRVGMIRPDPAGGFYYAPKKPTAARGETFPTIEAVKRSLEAE